ncbi:MAG: hypothetical protein WAQ99_10810 [Pyrinomonadaceae bacterium]
MTSLSKAFKHFPNEKILTKVIMHTSASVWKNDLKQRHVREWLENFNGEVFQKKYERLMALWLLSHFTFYNQQEVTHLCRVVYRDLIHRIVENQASSGHSASNLIESFFRSAIVTTSERTSGSGGFIAYFFRHANNLPMTLFEPSIDNLGKSIKNIIIIDDVTLTAGKSGQMHKFFEREVKKHSDKSFYLLTLVSSSSALDYLRNTFKIKAVSAVTLDSRDRCFSPESDMFCTYQHLRVRGQSLAEHYGKKIANKDPLGYQDGQCAFGFFYNTPDNTLPIFWCQDNGWIPIIGRFHKNYNVQNFVGHERFL